MTGYVSFRIGIPSLSGDHPAQQCIRYAGGYVLASVAPTIVRVWQPPNQGVRHPEPSSTLESIDTEQLVPAKPVSFTVSGPLVKRDEDEILNWSFPAPLEAHGVSMPPALKRS